MYGKIDFENRQALTEALPGILKNLVAAKNAFWSAFWTTGNANTDPVMKPLGEILTYLVKLSVPEGLIKDAGEWKLDEATSITRRGISDYNRVLVFFREPTESERGAVVQWLSYDDCPGWTGVTLQPVGSNMDGRIVWKARTTYDSSD